MRAIAHVRFGGPEVLTFLAALVGFVDDGRLRVVVDTVLPLEEAAAAQERVAGGHTHGKVILTVAAD